MLRSYQKLSVKPVAHCGEGTCFQQQFDGVNLLEAVGKVQRSILQPNDLLSRSLMLLASQSGPVLVGTADHVIRFVGQENFADIAG